MNQYGFNYFNFIFITFIHKFKIFEFDWFDFDHPIKLENFKLVNKSNKYEIKIVESILIHKLGPNLNDRGSSFPLSILQ